MKSEEVRIIPLNEEGYEQMKRSRAELYLSCDLIDIFKDESFSDYIDRMTNPDLNRKEGYHDGVYCLSSGHEIIHNRFREINNENNKVTGGDREKNG